MLENAMNDPAKVNQPSIKPQTADTALENPRIDAVKLTSPDPAMSPAHSRQPENLDDEALKGVAGGDYVITL